MPSEPHKGKWEIVLNAGGCALDAQQEAVHMCVVYIPDPDTADKWKVFYFSAYGEPDPTGVMKSRVIDFATTPPQITSQDIPDWPSPGEDWKARLFCSGHVFLDDGRLFAAGVTVKLRTIRGQEECVLRIFLIPFNRFG